METFHTVEHYFELVIKYLALAIEVVGTVILVHAVIMAVIGVCKRQKHARLKLAEGISLALEFKMGAEVLKSVAAAANQDWTEIGILAAIVAIRAAMVLLLHWEIKNELKHGNLSEEELHDIKTPLTQDIEPKKGSKKKTKDNTEE